MEVAADLRPILGPSLVRLDPMRIKQLHIKCTIFRSPIVYKAIDDLAKLSAQCMQLRAPLTCCEKMINSDNTMYLSWQYDEETNVSRLIGFAKVGRKKLFLYDSDMQTYEGEVSMGFSSF